jgi:hypothetical protein
MGAFDRDILGRYEIGGCLDLEMEMGMEMGVWLVSWGGLGESR